MENDRPTEKIDERIERLKRFYGVLTINELIVAQERHVEKLQEKTRRGLPTPIDDGAPNIARQG